MARRRAVLVLLVCGALLAAVAAWWAPAQAGSPSPGARNVALGVLGDAARFAYFSSPPGSPWDLATKPRSRAAYRKLITPLDQ